METFVWEAQSYARELLKSADYDKSAYMSISSSLARNTYSHGHCYNRDDCKKMGLKIDDTETSVKYLDELKKLVHIVNNKDDSLVTHYIHVLVPSRPEALEKPGDNAAIVDKKKSSKRKS